MADFDPNSAECNVFTFKEGLLSAVAHDLNIKVTRFALAIDEGSVVGTWDARSLVVQAIMRDGREAPDALGTRDADKIAKNIREDVLMSDRYPEIAFRSERIELSDGAAKITGTLTLAGRSKVIVVDANRVAQRWVAEVVLHQPDFGVKPYSAMLGTLKIKPDVRVRVSIPADRLAIAGA